MVYNINFHIEEIYKIKILDLDSFTFKFRMYSRNQWIGYAVFPIAFEEMNLQSIQELWGIDQGSYWLAIPNQLIGAEQGILLEAAIKISPYCDAKFSLKLFWRFYMWI